jgi:hypothetical protein
VPAEGSRERHVTGTRDVDNSVWAVAAGSIRPLGVAVTSPFSGRPCRARPSSPGGAMAEMDKNEQAKGKIAESNASTQARPESGELTDEQLDKVSGGQGAEFTSVSNVLKTRHDTAKNSISNIR